MKIGNKNVGVGNKPFVIAEVAQAHDGSLGQAHSFIEASKNAGADAVKFQTHIAEAESSEDEPFRVKFSFQDSNRFDYWKRMEFTPEQWHGLKQHCDDIGIEFLSSPFSLAAVELLNNLNVNAWKLGSGELTNKLMLDRIKQTKLPILGSCGLIDEKNIKWFINEMLNYNSNWALFQCTSLYPTPLQKVGLNVLSQLKEWGVEHVGLSDHSGTVYPSLAALSLGCELIEVHVTFDKGMFGPDTSSSLTFDELRHITDFSDALKIMRENPVDKSEMADELKDIASIFGKSLVARRNLNKGEVLKVDDLDARKPLMGIASMDYETVLGREVTQDVGAGDFLTKDLIK